MMINGAVWAPLVLLFFLRAMRGERPVSSIAWSGAFLGVSFLSGHHQIPIFIGLTMAGVWIYYLAVAQAVEPVLSSSPPTSKQDNTGLTACAWSFYIFSLKCFGPIGLGWEAS